MLDTLSKAEAEAGDVVILHACCHNPTGEDPRIEDGGAIAELIAARGVLPIVDLAYIGFGDGLVEDLTELRILTEHVPEMLVASSCSKNFALYRERRRCGCCFSTTRGGPCVDRGPFQLFHAPRPWRGRGVGNT